MKPRKGQVWTIPGVGAVHITWASRDGKAVHYQQVDPPHRAGLAAPADTWTRDDGP